MNQEPPSPWQDTAFFLGTLLLVAGGGLAIHAGLELESSLQKLIWAGVGLVWGAVLIRVWIARDERDRGH